MKLHADLRLPATVASAELAWTPSPLPGVERRLLERDGEEAARATSVVRYAPGSAFSPHTHGAGEEFLVLEGVFSDETGDFPAGFYVRNPPDSRHTPSSAPGATIFVKLRQMPPQEAEAVRIDTRDPALWRETGDGVAEAVLFAAPWEEAALVRLPPGHEGAPRAWPGGVEIFVIAGEIAVEGRRLAAGTWLRRPPGTTLGLSSGPGARLYRKSGHLG